ncbi:DUF2927 domain-containing protein [Balneolaceae bacterium]|jgi:hypothetical protein|nr:DUF2927 domain-containing protein [Balneolaceae bacterium]
MNKIAFYLIIFSILLFSCSNNGEGILSASNEEEDISSTTKLTEYEIDVINYFKDIALGFEFGDASRITRRWGSNMKIFIGGTPPSELLSELNTIINEINSLSTLGFSHEIVDDSLQSNYYIYFGSGRSYAEIFPSQSNLVESNWGLFTIYWDSSNELFTGHMYVDTYRASLNEQKHLLREELTQSLGLARDSYLYSDSIFQQAFSTKVTKYAQIDKDLIRLLYHPEMSVGLNANQVDSILRKILQEE